MFSMRKTHAVLAVCGGITVLALITKGIMNIASGETLGISLMLQIIACFLIATGNSVLALDRGSKHDLLGSIAILGALALLIVAMII